MQDAHLCQNTRVTLILTFNSQSDRHLLNMASSTPQQTLDALYAIIKSLSASSTEADFAKFGAFFAPDCKAWLKNMRDFENPGIGRQGAIDKLKGLMTEKYWSLDEREVLSSAVTTDGSRLLSETRKRLIVCGEPVYPFYETEVVVFNPDGLIAEMKLYSCFSSVASVIQQKTGVGPYAVADFKSQPKN